MVRLVDLGGSWCLEEWPFFWVDGGSEACGGCRSNHLSGVIFLTSGVLGHSFVIIWVEVYSVWLSLTRRRCTQRLQYLLLTHHVQTFKVLQHVLNRLEIRITWLTLLYHFIWHTLITSAAVRAPAPAGTLSLAGVFGERLADNVRVENVVGGDDALSEAGVWFRAAY